MKNFYYYLVSSLPMLYFGMKMPFGWHDFIEECSRSLSEEDLKNISSISIDPGSDKELGIFLVKEWKRFDIALRNELTKARAAKKNKDPNNYLRPSQGLEPFIAPLAHWAINQDSLIEAELYLDKVRWEKIEELKAGHYFDIEYISAYALELRILERWDRINAGSGMKALERLAGRV